MEDVIASFQYYLTHINKGQRPFMTLGFSQGSSPLWELAENRFEKICGAEFGAATRKNHIVTYATGIPGHGKIAANKPVKFSESYNDINVITAWNPYEEADTLCSSNQLGVHAQSGAPTTNPITWTIDEDYHLMMENPKLNQNTLLGARVHNKLGILLVRKAKDPATSCKSSGNMYMGMHGQDISLFSASIIQNMQDRIEAWKAQYGK
jgi:lipopolysaccharide biosynthesis glycosyltransferase